MIKINIYVWSKLLFKQQNEIYKTVYDYFDKNINFPKIENLPGIDYWKYEINNIPIISSKYYIEYKKNQLQLRIYHILYKKNFFLEQEIKNKINTKIKIESYKYMNNLFNNK